MNAVTARPHPRAWQTGSFVAIALVLGALSWVAASGPVQPGTRAVLLKALTFDLAVTLPAAYYLFVARPRQQHWWAVAAVAVLGALRAAALWAPGGAGRLLIMSAAEVALIAFVAVRGRAAWRSRSRHDDPLTLISRVLAGTIAVPIAANAVASELAVFYYALLSWGRRPHAPAGFRAFTVHRRGGAALLLGVLAAMLLLETSIVHLLLLHWSPRVAWPVLFLDLYGALWLVAFARALVLRPILVGADTVLLRTGLAWTVAIDRSQIEEARACVGPRPRRRSTDPLVMAALTSPSVLLRLREPVQAAGLWGRRVAVTSIAVAIDEPAAFLRCLE